MNNLGAQNKESENKNSQHQSINLPQNQNQALSQVDMIQQLQKQLKYEQRRCQVMDQYYREREEIYSKNFFKLTLNTENEIDILSSELKDLKTKYQNALDESNFLKSQIQPSSPEDVKTEEETKENAKDFYDAIIDCSNMLNLLEEDKGWNILIKDKERYEEKVQKSVRRITAVGFENRGKSFLLGQIMGRKIPTGQHLTTYGICAMYPEENEGAQLCLDAAGVHLPIRKAKLKKKFKKLFEGKDEYEIDKVLFADVSWLEKLMRDFITTHSEIILIVINKLQRDDQRMIREVLLNRSNEDKTIYIVHNWKDCESIKQVESRIDQDIIGTFGAKEKIIKKNQYVYSEDYEVNGKKNRIEHIVLAKESTTAGDEFNKKSIQYLKQSFESKQHNEPFNLIDEFNTYLKNVFRNYYGSIENNVNSFEEVEIELKMESNQPQKFQLKNPEKYYLKQSTYDQTGLLSLQSPHITLNYAIKQTEVDEKNQKKLMILCDINGKIKDGQIKVELKQVSDMENKQFHSIILSGAVEDPCKDLADKKGYKDVSQDKRKFGQFVVQTESFDLEGFEKQGEPQCSFGNKDFPGQLILIWLLVKPTNLITTDREETLCF